MGKRFSESAAKKAAGLARKADQARAKVRAEKEKEAAAEAAKWEEGSRKPNKKKIEEQNKLTEKLAKKQERDRLLAEEEAQLGKGGKGKRK
ncbi:uncharacterized protein SCODWIG_00601 [Saccharomycodes ludwigii]|uniref:LSO1/LSO2 domain-containing protein n=1 Tax=Saccharomycodes ludwigii TaxID=36035 RepID=A0A376B3Z5_9ASCO|nr:hypothetical protein SCDLUD_004531 [Saccharomycodes ludwigii]KAH3899105.1 hypothetical protein SCDLUD_004531 [Saccharomycodes ludwigii]SSD58840.1 uncharacterized protein SCODWIG_00601 [Saccharomycodes ludwigii]